MSHDEFCTPPPVASRVERFFDGPVDLDPASNNRSIIKARKIYTAGALHLPWRARTVYENCPFSDPYLELFADKGIAERRTHGFEHIRLVPVATSTVWWQKAQGVRAAACGHYADKPSTVFTKRLRFIGLDGRVEKDSARFDVALFYYGNRHARFLEIFTEPELAMWWVEAPYPARHLPPPNKRKTLEKKNGHVEARR
jgi:hypothetical protein